MTDISPLLIQLLLLICMIGPANSQGLVDSIDLSSGEREPVIQVQVSARIEPDNDLVVSQQIILYIEVATPDWFSGGTRIGQFEIDDVVVLRRDKFSVNSIRRQANETWSVQLWSITLYPQVEGSFIVPEIELQISTAREGGRTASVLKRTKPISFSVRLPDEVKRQSQLLDVDEAAWVASTRFQLDEHYAGDLTDLEIGDAVKRTVEIRSENIAAMMLPPTRFSAPTGLAVYQNPSKITDRVNRGDYIASRTETATYVVEKAGAYRLPKLDFYWWDLNSQRLKHESLPEQIISTRGVSMASAADVQNSSVLEASFKRKRPNLLIAIGLGLLLIVVGWWYLSRYGFKANAGQNSLGDLEQQFKTNCRRQAYIQASSSFYKWFEHQLESSELAASEYSVRRWLREKDRPRVLELFDELMAAAHNRPRGKNGGAPSFEGLMAEIKPLLANKKISDKGKELIGFRLN